MQFLPPELFDQMDRQHVLMFPLPWRQAPIPSSPRSPLLGGIIGFNPYAFCLTQLPSFWPSWDGKFDLLCQLQRPLPSPNSKAEKDS